jgi:hypothetical protein
MLLVHKRYTIFRWHFSTRFLVTLTHSLGLTVTLIYTQHIRQDSSGRGISPTQRPVPDNTQRSQETDVHAPGEIRTRNPSKRKAEDSCLKPRGHWDRFVYKNIQVK